MGAHPAAAVTPGGSRALWRDRRALLLVLALALALRLACVRLLPPGTPFASVDAQGYRILAENLLARGTFSLRTEPPYVADGIRTPVYPAFLALLLLAGGNPEHTVPLAQALLDTATVALVYALTLPLAGPRRALLAALIYALNPITVLFVGDALTEILTAFLLALTFCLWVRALGAARRRSVLMAAAGVSAAACILCKPNDLLLVPILMLGTVVERRRLGRQTWQEVALLAAGALLALAPWVIRNRAVFGRAFLTLTTASNLSRVSAVATLFELQGERVAPWTPRWEEAYVEHVVAPTAARYGWPEGQAAQTAHEQARRSAQLLSTARAILREHPGAFLASHLKGVLHSLVPELHRHWLSLLTGRPWPVTVGLADVLGQAAAALRRGDAAAAWHDVGAWWRLHPPLAQALWLLSVAVSAAACVGAAAGAWGLRRRPGVALAMVATLLYLVVMPGPIGYVRFWMPGVPLVAALAGCAFRKRAA